MIEITSMTPTLVKFFIMLIFLCEVILRIVLMGPLVYCRNIWNLLDCAVVLLCLCNDAMNFGTHTAILEKFDGFIMAFRLWYAIRMIRKISITKELQVIPMSAADLQEEELFTLAQDKHMETQDELARVRIANAKMDADLRRIQQILARHLVASTLNDPVRMMKHSVSWHSVVPHSMALTVKPAVRRNLSQETMPKPSRKPSRQTVIVE